MFTFACKVIALNYYGNTGTIDRNYRCFWNDKKVVKLKYRNSFHTYMGTVLSSFPVRFPVIVRFVGTMFNNCYITMFSKIYVRKMSKYLRITINGINISAFFVFSLLLALHLYVPLSFLSTLRRDKIPLSSSSSVTICVLSLN